MKAKLRWILLLISLPALLFGQSSGKLVGVVKDKGTNEPLPGVNISLEGTTMGAASDVDGYFVILNVPVGTYTVRANFIGYQDVMMEKVRVSADVTAEVNFSLSETAIEGQAVVITAEKPLVEKHVTQSVSLVTSDDLENMPVRGFNNVIATQNSVVVQDGNVHIRGGRHDEVGYYIDGASSIDPLTNTQSLHIIQEAVEEFQVLAGGYTAEYGGANSGIVRTELRTGSNRYKLSLDVQTDKLADAGEEFLGTYSYRHHNAVATLSGPLLNNKLRFFVAGENAYKGDRSVRFTEPFTLNNLIDSNPENPRVAAGLPDTISSYGLPGGFTPQREEDLWALQGTLLFDLSPLQFRLSGSYSDQTQQFSSFYENAQVGSSPNTPLLNLLNERSFDDRFSNLLLTGKMTYILDTKSILDASVSYFNSVLDREDSYFGNNWQQWWDSSAVSQHTGGAVNYASRWRPEQNYIFNGIYFARDGAPYRDYRVQNQNYLSGALNFVTQANRHHELKAGGEFRQYNLRRFTIRSNAMNTLATFNVDRIEDVPVETWISQSVPNNYGYDIYGNETDGNIFNEDGIQIGEKPKKPAFGSVYVQDKIEYDDLIINAGLRYDYFDSQGRELRNPTNPQRDLETRQILDSEWRDKKVFQHLSPRLGFSFPVSEKTVFYMQYGKFIQLPELETMYAGVQRYNYEYIAAGISFLDPTGYGLDPIRTTSYEIGFRQQMGPVAAMDIAGFYRNVKGQVQVDRITPDASAGLVPFNILVNGDFTTTKGLELGLTLRRINRLQGRLNYTLTEAEGTASSRNAHVSAFEQNTPRPTIINPLNFSQKHRGSVSLDYRYGQNEGGAVLQNLGLNTLFTFNSGHPYTFARSEVGQAGPYTAGTNYMNDTRSRRALEGVGSSTTPFNWNVDLRLDKTFRLSDRLAATAYMRVNNVFNTKNVINVFAATGSAEDDGFIDNLEVSQAYIDANGGEDYVNMYRAINIDNGQAYWDELNLELYGSPRQIFFGLKLNY